MIEVSSHYISVSIKRLFSVSNRESGLLITIRFKSTLLRLEKLSGGDVEIKSTFGIVFDGGLEWCGGGEKSGGE